MRWTLNRVLRLSEKARFLEEPTIYVPRLLHDRFRGDAGNESVSVDRPRTFLENCQGVHFWSTVAKHFALTLYILISYDGCSKSYGGNDLSMSGKDEMRETVSRWEVAGEIFAHHRTESQNQTKQRFSYANEYFYFTCDICSVRCVRMWRSCNQLHLEHGALQIITIFLQMKKWNAESCEAKDACSRIIERNDGSL